MQKSKSSSNVGQFVSKKIFKTRSKSQTRTSSPTKVKWTPQGNCTWTSDNGRQVQLRNSHLQNLTDIEAKILQRVAIEKINQLNIGVTVAIPSESDTTSKTQKRRPLAKKKAMTTSFFDIGKKEDKGSNISIFGNSLEDCLANDIKRRTNLTAASERGSRNSITSLFRGGSSSKVRSCESLPSTSTPNVHNLPHSDSNSSSNIEGTSAAGTTTTSAGNGNLAKTAAMLMSRSQSDVRRSSQDFEYLHLNNNNSILSAASSGSGSGSVSGGISPPPVNEELERQVPIFVQECIKHLEKFGLHSVGLFRVSTSKKRVRQMREELDRGSNTFIDPETCPHDVATLLKEFLRDLPEPLLCRNLYKAFIKTQKIRNRRLQLEALSHLVQLLPTAHRDTLFVLLRFLAKVASCCDDLAISDDSSNIVTGNKMDSNNLATVFAPNILRSSLPGEENNEQESMGDVINVIRTMIDHYEELFRVQADLMDEIYANMIDTFPEQLNYLFERRSAADKYSQEELDGAAIGANTGKSATAKQQIYHFNNEPPPPPHNQDCQNNSESASRLPSIPSSRRIYSRDDVMHGNAVSKGDPPQDPSRRRSSKSRHSESDSFTSSQRSSSSVKYKTGNSSDNSNTPSTTTTATTTTSTTTTPQKSSSSSTAKVEFHSVHHPHPQQQQQSQQTISSSSRRLSSPYILDRSGVVTASLKIPVQMQQTVGPGPGPGAGPGPTARATAAAGRDNTQDDDEVFYRESGVFNLSNIPFIEDSTTYGNELGNCIEGFPITGSLLFGSASGTGGGGGTSGTKTTDKKPTTTRSRPSSSGTGQVFQIPIAFESDRVSPPSSVSEDRAAAGESATKQTSFLSPSPSSSSSAAAVAPSSTNNQFSNKMEQKLPTSITNIGGAILRSKTADFERMATPSSSSSSSQSPLTSALGGAAMAMTQQIGAGRRAQSSSKDSQKGQLYKRQELISSAKRK